MAECKKLVVEVCEYNLALSLEELAYIKVFTEKTTNELERSIKDGIHACERIALSLEELAYIKGFTEKTMLASVTWERCQPTKTGLLFAQENTPYRVYE